MGSDAIEDSVSPSSSGRANAAVEIVSEPASSFAGRAQESLTKIVAASGDRVQDAVAELPASLSDASATGERLVLRGRQLLHHRVKKQPVEALLLAGAIGYLVGWAASRS